MCPDQAVRVVYHSSVNRLVIFKSLLARKRCATGRMGAVEETYQRPLLSRPIHHLYLRMVFFCILSFIEHNNVLRERMHSLF